MNNSSHNSKYIVVQNTLADSDKLAHFLASYTDTIDAPDDIHNELRLAVEEAFVNITSYAFPAEETHSISIELQSSSGKAGKEISVTFTDSGIAFNPLTDCNFDLDTDDHCEGGMGIHLIKSLTDQQQYDRIEQRNVFTVTKHYTKQSKKQL